jgi:phosphoribosylformylglycinamidine synthase
VLLKQVAESEWDSFKSNMNALAALSEIGCVRSAFPVGPGGVHASLALMAFGNNTGVEARCSVSVPAALPEAFYQGSVLVEIDGAAFKENQQVRETLKKAACHETAALTLNESVFRIIDDTNGNAEISLAILRHAYESPLAKVYPQTSDGMGTGDWGSGIGDRIKVQPSPLSTHMDSKQQPYSLLPTPYSPLVILPVFPGTNCEWDMERAFREAGARTRLVIFRNRNGNDIEESRGEFARAIKEAQILALAGGFSAGDEPDGSGKFIANVLRSPVIADAVSDLIENRDGLVLGICNGFQALIKLGLVPYGEYWKAEPSMPPLTFNRIGRHVSRMVRTRVMECNSPWLAQETPGTVHLIPVSHGEGRLVVGREEGEALFKNGQVPFCYADENGLPAMHEPDNPNGSDFAIEGLCSPDGRILGKMGHSERCGEYVHINIPGNKKQNIFSAGVRYWQAK